MNIAILATGNEIIQGDTLNTNGYHIAQLVNFEGLALGLHLSCADDDKELDISLSFLAKHHNIIILTGGLGPTSDDRTRFALARFLKTQLVEFTDARVHIEDRLSRANLALNDGHLQQALFPEGAVLLPNRHGTAMGCYIKVKHKHYILLPGPPRECLPMFKDFALPLIQHTQHHGKQLLKWRLFGVAEGEMSQVLEKALASHICEIGYRLETPYLEFKVRCDPHQVDEIKTIVDPLVKPFIIASVEEKASAKLRSRLAQLREPIVIIDEATGGKLQTLLLRPNNTHRLKFHKTDAIACEFHITGLEEHWSDKNQTGMTSVTIKYKHNDIEGSETYQLPHYSALVVDSAAEWLSFRLFHLINELH